MAVTEKIAAIAPGRSGPSLATRRALTHAGILLALLLAWELAARAEWLDPLLFPRPTAILEAFWRLYVVQGNVYYHLGITLGEVLAGYVAGSILGVVLGGLVGFNATVRRYLKPYVIVLEATPRIAVAPLIIAMLGFGWSSKIAIVMLVCFFAPFINTMSGVLQVDDDKLELLRSLRANAWQIFRKLVLPDAMPVIMAGLRLAMAAALSGALVAEFISANAGMGVLIDRYTGSLNMASAFACVFTLSAVGFAIFRSMEAIDTRLVFWVHPERVATVSGRRAAVWRRRWGNGR